MSSQAVCEQLQLKKLPQALVTYLFCSPTLDGELRCLPRSGGYYDQDQKDMVDFRIIESRVFDHMSREFEKQRMAMKHKGPSGQGPIKTVTVAEKDL